MFERDILRERCFERGFFFFKVLAFEYERVNDVNLEETDFWD